MNANGSRIRRLLGLAALSAAQMTLLAATAGATNGYLLQGIGTRSKALAGAGVALPEDALASAVNPAGLAFVGKHKDAGLAIFSPHRQYTVVGNPSGYPGTFPLNPGTVKSDSEYFPVPNLGLSWEVSSTSTFGFALYGQGGMNTDYPTATFHASSPTGVDLTQLFAVPAWAVKLGDRHALGIGLVLAAQRFKIEGVGAFALFSSDPSHVSNNGYDLSYGYGARVGYLGRFTDRFSFGASYQSRIYMGAFKDYRGLFAEHGGFDIPANFSVGIAVKATPAVTVAFDTQEIYYSQINSIGNPLLPNLLQAPLGADNGAGFGWRDMTVYKLGVEIHASDPWTWRFGASHGRQPIPSSEVLFNILAPGVIEDHYTFGFSRKLANAHELSLGLMYAPPKEVSGPNPLEAPGQQTIKLKMDQWDVEIGFSW